MADTRFWSKEILTQFLEIYRKHPALWMVKSKDYTNKNLKDKGHRELIELCKQVIENPDKNFFCKKNQSIRSCFRKELKKVEQSKRSGASENDVYTPSLWYFDLLLFTRDSETCSDSISNVDHEENSDTVLDIRNEKETEMQNETGEENSDIEEETPDPKNGTVNSRFITNSRSKKFKSLKDDKSAFMRTCVENLNKKEDEHQLFGSHVAAKLKKMNETQQIYAENLINQILLNRLNDNIIISESLGENSVPPYMRQVNIPMASSSASSVFTPEPSPDLPTGAGIYFHNFT
ncbi:unnamed protein product [Psylliodes chrysocephalus]|uniref:MADF domain-containing protein n=1 Tax=Psylliodes chrysocephalus TaxID=3402493 RepID=A0A9P0CG69_9CUCU|nr:unnamed protein product [Psylliodes chrysocephala]